MYRLLHRVLKPVPTSPFDPYRWRTDSRSVSEKVLSGMRLGAGLIAGFLVLVMAFGGLSTLPDGTPAYGHYGRLVSWTMLCAASVIMLWTANRWAPYVPAFFCLPALFKALSVLLVGPNPNSTISFQRLSRVDAAEVFAACVLVIALTWRFVGGRPAATTFFDRLALTFFVLATIESVVTQYHWPAPPLISGLAALLVAWCAYRWKLAEKQSTQTSE